MTSLYQLLKHLHQPFRYDGPDTAVRDIAYDSRKVRKDSLFVAIRGYRSDGHRFVAEAQKKGAVACVVEKPVKSSLPRVMVGNSRRALAELSHPFYHSAVLPYPVLGITGTNGKTTITHLLYQLAEAAGEKPALIGTLGAKFEHYRGSEERTTPESRDLARFFGIFEEKHVTAVFMEVSSHAIALDRVYGIGFRGALFTNLTRDHLDFHTDMEAYFQTKAKLFHRLPPASFSIINTDDPFGKRLYGMTAGKKYSYSLRDAGTDVHFGELSVNIDGIRGILHTPSGSLRVNAPLLGDFNAENIAAAVAAWLQLFPGKKELADNFPFAAVSGRMEMIPTSRGTVVIDYAHTPDAMKKALAAVSGLIGRRRIITVFGCGGDRDHDKRAMMGAAAETYSDRIILTNDNPRSEAPQKIAEDILSGIENKDTGEICLDRREALARAYRLSEKGDIVMILGKGAESYMEIGGKRIPFLDKEEIEKLERNK